MMSAPAATLAAVPSRAEPGPLVYRCPEPVVPVHDMGRDATESAGLDRALSEAGFRTTTFTCGEFAATSALWASTPGV
ncbi:hypothetical protein [Nocardia aurantiaca]|uniref:Uncharacterized protein n=1 Tax=Nocardia aurantiaca TaxID=2675850 RepID=A0A6I3L7H8_9NOCA|nr:hypothetical protein [Nocardia aurantiaca]MTE17348.1 hypothetical protein [Nocardia aurantiaca]